MKRSEVLIILIVLAVAVIGVLSIYSSASQRVLELERMIYRRQVLWIILSIIFLILMSNFSYRRLWDWAYILYGGGIILLLLVMVLGRTRMGAQRWLEFWGFNFQPSELAKLFTIIFFARYFSRQSVYSLHASGRRLDITRAIVAPLLLSSIPIFLILEQPDLGSAAMILFIVIAMLFLAEVKKRYIFLIILAGLLISPLCWQILKGYQRDRLLVFLNPNIDPLGAGYTIIQSKIAIGSGGLFGKGWLSGTQGQLRFLPESHTDFIFATFAEEWGFWGSTVLLALYYFLIRYAVDTAYRAHDRFAKMLCSGIAAMFLIQIFINIAMTLGLAPVVGLPLPLMSYGGSSLLISFVAIGIVINIRKTQT